MSTHYWLEKPGIEKIFTLILLYLPHLPLTGLLLIFGLLAAMLIIALTFFQTYLAKKNNIPKTHIGLWLLYLAFIPPLFLWVISQYVPVYIERALLPSHAIFCIWFAWVLTETKMPKVIHHFSWILIIISTIIGFSQHLNYSGFPYGDFKAINQSIQSRLENEDVVIHSSKLSYLPAYYFDKDFQQGFIIDLPGSTVDTLAPAIREILRVTEYENIEQATLNASRIWFIIYQQSIEEYASSNKLTHPHLAYLDKNFTLALSEHQDGICIFLYKK